jgi:hypothetical protein
LALDAWREPGLLLVLLASPGAAGAAWVGTACVTRTASVHSITAWSAGISPAEAGVADVVSVGASCANSSFGLARAEACPRAAAGCGDPPSLPAVVASIFASRAANPLVSSASSRDPIPRTAAAVTGNGTFESTSVAAWVGMVDQRLRLWSALEQQAARQ